MLTKIKNPHRDETLMRIVRTFNKEAMDIKLGMGSVRKFRRKLVRLNNVLNRMFAYWESDNARKHVKNVRKVRSSKIRKVRSSKIRKICVNAR